MLQSPPGASASPSSDSATGTASLRSRRELLTPLPWLSRLSSDLRGDCTAEEAPGSAAAHAAAIVMPPLLPTLEAFASASLSLAAPPPPTARLARRP